MSNESESDTIIRVERRERFLVVEKAVLEDSRLDFHARGILCYLLSRPSGWIVRVRDLMARTKDAPRPCGRDSVLSGLQTLEAAGYLQRRRVRGPGGRFERMEYLVREEPDIPPSSGKSPETPSPEEVPPTPANPGPTEEREIKNSLSPREQESLSPPSLEDVLSVAATIGVPAQMAREFWAFYESEAWQIDGRRDILPLWRHKLKLWGVRADWDRHGRTHADSRRTAQTHPPTDWKRRETW